MAKSGHNGKIRKMTLAEKKKRAAKAERTDRKGKLIERSAKAAGIVVAKDLRELRQ